MVTKIRITKKTLLSCLMIITALAIAAVPFYPERAQADRLQQRSLRIDSAVPGATTTHNFKFSYVNTTQPVGSMMFEYCTSPLPEITCDSPQGMNASAAVLEQQIGERGYFILTAQTNRIILTRAPAIPPTVNPSEYDFSGIKNPTDTQTFYVRITTYESTDATGAFTDFGSVANSTTEGVDLNTEVPPYLKFCVGVTVNDDCSSSDDSFVDLGNLTSSRAASGTSQMQAATNGEFGLSIVVYGTTMTSGNNVIPALESPTVSAPGNAQFGINLRRNTNPGVGQDPTGGGIANPTSRYNTADRYTFVSGDTVATSPAVTDNRKFTVSYLANVPPSQQPGVYTATLTYICTATF